MINWGDGSAATAATVDEQTDSYSGTHVYANNPAGSPDGAFTVTATVTASYGPTAQSHAQVTVDNVPPSVVDLALSAGSILEGGTVTLTGAVTDPGVLDSKAVEVTWGDQTASAATFDPVARTFTATHGYAPSGTNGASVTDEIIATATDSDGGEGSARTSVVVDKASPILSGLTFQAASYLDGATASLTGVVVPGNQLDANTLTVSWGDGTTSPQPLAAGQTSFLVGHVYQDSSAGQPGGVFTATATLTDNVSRLSNGGTTTVTVANVPPVINAVTDTSSATARTPAGQPVGFTVAFTAPGVLETQTAIVIWGDGANSTTYALPPGAGKLDLTHVFAAQGTYAVTVRIEDEAGGISAPEGALAYVGASSPPSSLPAGLSRKAAPAGHAGIAAPVLPAGPALDFSAVVPSKNVSGAAIISSVPTPVAVTSEAAQSGVVVTTPAAASLAAPLTLPTVMSSAGISTAVPSPSSNTAKPAAETLPAVISSGGISIAVTSPAGSTARPPADAWSGTPTPAPSFLPLAAPPVWLSGSPRLPGPLPSTGHAPADSVPLMFTGAAAPTALGVTQSWGTLSAIARDADPAPPIRLRGTERIRTATYTPAPPRTAPPPARLFDDVSGEFDDSAASSPLGMGLMAGIDVGDGWLQLPPPVLARGNAFPHE